MTSHPTSTQEPTMTVTADSAAHDTRIVAGTNGRLYFVAPNGHADLARCSWLVDAGYDEDGESIILECAAHLTRLDDDGWECAAGHHHFTYGSAAWAAEDAAMAFAERHGWDD